MWFDTWYNVKKGSKVKGKYFRTPFVGTVTHKECVNNGKSPKWAFYIKLDSPIETIVGPSDSICFIDGDQFAACGNVLEVINA
jgi:hypothetical protein